MDLPESGRNDANTERRLPRAERRLFGLSVLFCCQPSLLLPEANIHTSIPGMNSVDTRNPAMSMRCDAAKQMIYAAAAVTFRNTADTMADGTFPRDLSALFTAREIRA